MSRLDRTAPSPGRTAWHALLEHALHQWMAPARPGFPRDEAHADGTSEAQGAPGRRVAAVTGTSVTAARVAPVSIAAARRQESDDLGALFVRGEPAKGLHLMAGDNLVRFGDEAVK